ncbi:hypothetical protein PG995_002848 [Apiospora arundinis]
MSGQYYHILDLQSTELDKLFAMSQQDASERMQISSSVMERVMKKIRSIFEHTEKHASSMHFITNMTLVFLPGTFVGAIFSTPIFGDPPEGDPSTWVLNKDLLVLFLEISLPMMFIFTLMVFVNNYRFTRARGIGRDIEVIKDDNV